MEQKNTSMFLTLIAFSLFILLLDKAGILSNARGLIEGIAIVPERAVHQAITDQKSQEEYATGKSAQAELEKLKKENEDLRLTLGIAKSGGNTFIRASVLSTSRGFIIDKGGDDGVHVGQTVVFKNIFIGKIQTVGKKVSRVLLPLEKNSVVGVKDAQTGALGNVYGEDGGMSLSEVTLAETLTEGDIVRTVGNVDEAGLGIRPGFLIGTVAYVRKSSNQLFQEAKIIPLIDYQNVQNVFIVL